MKERMPEGEFIISVGKLIAGNFSEVIDKVNLDSFWGFVSTRGKKSGGFVITMPMPGGSAGWLFYKYENETEDSLEFTDPDVHLPTGDIVDITLPKDLIGFPIWSLADQKALSDEKN